MEMVSDDELMFIDVVTLMEGLVTWVRLGVRYCGGGRSSLRPPYPSPVTNRVNGQHYVKFIYEMIDDIVKSITYLVKNNVETNIRELDIGKRVMVGGVHSQWYQWYNNFIGIIISLV